MVLQKKDDKTKNMVIFLSYSPMKHIEKWWWHEAWTQRALVPSPNPKLQNFDLLHEFYTRSCKCIFMPFTSTCM
jgi:hypothetical protein